MTALPCALIVATPQCRIRFADPQARSKEHVKRFQRGSLGRRALVACLLCASIVCLRGVGNPPEISAPPGCPDNTWTATANANAPAARCGTGSVDGR